MTRSPESERVRDRDEIVAGVAVSHRQSEPGGYSNPRGRLPYDVEGVYNTEVEGDEEGEEQVGGEDPLGIRVAEPVDPLNCICNLRHLCLINFGCKRNWPSGSVGNVPGEQTYMSLGKPEDQGHPEETREDLGPQLGLHIPTVGQGLGRVTGIHPLEIRYL